MGGLGSTLRGVNRLRLRLDWGFGVGPVAASGGDIEVDVLFELERYGVDAGLGRLGVEAEDVAVRDVIGDG